MLALSAIWIVAAATFVVSHYARRGSASLRFCIAAVACAVISALLIPIVGAPWHPTFETTSGTLITAQRISVALWWLSAARLILLSGRISYERRTDASRLVFDLASGAVHLGVIVIILSLAFGVFVPGLIATSGVIAVVIGLALQNTLGDLFSGIAISIERPFSTGDHIWIEGAMEGVVLETNWRATRIVTDTQDIATVPNSVVAKARILNRSLPTEIRAESVRLVLEPGVLPQRGVELFNAATLTLGDSPAHSWSVLCSDLRGEGTFYEIRFSAPRRSLSAVRSSFLHQVARHARYAGIAFGMQSGTPPRAVEAPDAAHLLMETGLFHGLKEAELKLLAQKAIIRRGGEGEVLIQEGATDTSLLVIAQGVLEVSLDPGTGTGAATQRRAGRLRR